MSPLSSAANRCSPTGRKFSWAARPRFLAQFFPLFLLGAVFGKLMDDSGSVSAVADFMTESLGERHVMLAVVLAGALVTYGGVSLFVAFFVLGSYGAGAFSRGRQSPAD